MLWIFFILPALIWAFVCDAIAKNQGRSYGFILGFLFGIFAIIGYLIAGKTIEKQAEDLKKLQFLMKE